MEENSPFIAHDPSPSVVPSQRLNAEENKSNQNRLIELLTARGSISEVTIVVFSIFLSFVYTRKSTPDT